MKNLLQLITNVTFFFLYGWCSQTYIIPLNNFPNANQFFIFSFTTLILVIIFLAKFEFKRIIIKINKLDITFITIILLIIVNRFFIVNYSYYSLKYFELLGVFILYFILRNSSSLNFTFIYLGIIIGGICQAVLGYLQLLKLLPSNDSLFQVTGSFLNPGPLSGYLASCCLVSLYTCLYRTKLISKPSELTATLGLDFKVLLFIIKVTSVVGIILMSPLLIILQSRSAWLGLVFSTIILLSFRFDFKIWKIFAFSSWYKRTVIVLSILIILILSIVFLYHLKEKSVDGRFLIWKTTTEIIKDNPITGIGYDRFRAEYMQYQARSFKGSITDNNTVTDNIIYAFDDPLQFLAENGIIIGLMGLVFVIMLLIPSVQNANTTLGRAGLVGILVFSLSSYPSYILSIKIIGLTFIALLAKELKPLTIVKLNLYKTRRDIVMGIIFTLIPISIYTLFTQMNLMYRSYLSWDKANNLFKMKRFHDANIYYDQAMSSLKTEGIFLMQYGKSLALDNDLINSQIVLSSAKFYCDNTLVELAYGDVCRVLKQYDKAEKAYLTAHDMAPGLFLPEYSLAKLYLVNGMHQKAKMIAKKLLIKQVKISSHMIKSIVLEMDSITRLNDIYVVK